MKEITMDVTIFVSECGADVRQTWIYPLFWQ